MFTFNAYGNTLVVTAEDLAKERTDPFADGIADLGLAMTIANSKLIWNPRSKPGIWDDVNDTTYQWVEGNFFD